MIKCKYEESIGLNILTAVSGRWAMKERKGVAPIFMERRREEQRRHEAARRTVFVYVPTDEDLRLIDERRLSERRMKATKEMSH